MKKTLTVAIPAFNEEKNIVRLLKSVKKQKSSNFTLKEICVFSDGSTDKTAELIKKNFDNIKLFEFKKNIGKNKRINQILKYNQSDILVQLDADVYLKDNRVFDHLLSTFYSEKADLVCAYHLANQPKNFVGKLAYFGYMVWDKSRDSLGDEGIRYYCEGGLRAFSRELTSELEIPEDRHMGEDSYSFYFAVENGYKVAVNKKAIVYIDLAENYKDYIRKMRRFLLEPGLMRSSFDTQLTEKYETLTTSVKMKTLIKELLYSPIIGSAYLIVQSITKFQAYFYRPPIVWEPIQRK